MGLACTPLLWCKSTSHVSTVLTALSLIHCCPAAPLHCSAAWPCCQLPRSWAGQLAHRAWCRARSCGATSPPSCWEARWRIATEVRTLNARYTSAQRLLGASATRRLLLPRPLLLLGLGIPRTVLSSVCLLGVLHLHAAAAHACLLPTCRQTGNGRRHHLVFPRLCSAARRCHHAMDGSCRPHAAGGAGGTIPGWVRRRCVLAYQQVFARTACSPCGHADGRCRNRLWRPC